MELLNNLDVEVLALGEILHPTTEATFGPEAENMLRKLTFDYLTKHLSLIHISEPTRPY